MLYILAGALTGFVVGLTGVGGGALMTPLLLIVFGVAMPTAVGTDLWFAALTKLVALGIHRPSEVVDVQVLRRLWLGSLPATVLTLLALAYFPMPAKLVALHPVLAACLVVTAIGMLLQRRLHAIGRQRRLQDESRFRKWQPALTVAAGAATGVLVALTSVGAGALGVVMLSYLYPLRLTPLRLVATDIAHAIPLALVAGIGHLLIGHVDFPLLLSLLCGSVPGVWVGARLAHRLQPERLRHALALVLLAVAAKLLAG